MYPISPREFLRILCHRIAKVRLCTAYDDPDSILIPLEVSSRLSAGVGLTGHHHCQDGSEGGHIHVMSSTGSALTWFPVMVVLPHCDVGRLFNRDDSTVTYSGSPCPDEPYYLIDVFIGHNVGKEYILGLDELFNLNVVEAASVLAESCIDPCMPRGHQGLGSITSKAIENIPLHLHMTTTGVSARLAEKDCDSFPRDETKHHVAMCRKIISARGLGGLVRMTGTVTRRKR